MSTRDTTGIVVGEIRAACGREIDGRDDSDVWEFIREVALPSAPASAAGGVFHTTQEG